MYRIVDGHRDILTLLVGMNLFCVFYAYTQIKHTENHTESPSSSSSGRPGRRKSRRGGGYSAVLNERKQHRSSVAENALT